MTADGDLGLWVVYMAIDDGAILIEGREDDVTPGRRDAAQVNRIPHVVGRGATAKAAKADARRQLGHR